MFPQVEIFGRLLSWLIPVGSSCPLTIIFKGWWAGEGTEKPVQWQVSRGGIYVGVREWLDLFFCQSWNSFSTRCFPLLRLMRSRRIFPSSIFCIWRPHYCTWAAASLCLCACGLLTICQHGWVGGTREGFSVDFSNQFRSQVCNAPSIFNGKMMPEISVWKLSCGVRECWENLQGVTGKHRRWWAKSNGMSLWSSRVQACIWSWFYPVFVLPQKMSLPQMFSRETTAMVEQVPWALPCRWQRDSGGCVFRLLPSLRA